MKKFILIALIFAGMTISSTAFAETKVAVIDIQAVVNKSAQVQALKKENQAKAKELQKWIETCRADIAKQQTQEGKDKLTKKYDADLKKKQEANRKAYKEKLQAIDKSITETIINEAKSKGYTLVLTKQGAVLYGGDDITESVKKIVK